MKYKVKWQWSRDGREGRVFSLAVSYSLVGKKYREGFPSFGLLFVR
jgi:hypothetical protein